jgi:hypothetical protein
MGVLILLRLSGCGGGIWIGLWAGPTILLGRVCRLFYSSGKFTVFVPESYLSIFHLPFKALHGLETF